MTRTVLITGAQQGIGAAVARSLAAPGTHLLLNYLDDRAQAEAVAADVEDAGASATLLAGDVRDAAVSVAMLDAAATHGGVDILVNNAAIFPRVPFLDMQARDWDEVMAVNLRAVFLLTQAVCRQMVEAGRPGVVVNISSVAAYRGSPRGVHYVTAKAGIIGFTRAVALEMAGHGIRVNAVAPGLVDTAQPRFGMSEEEIAEAGTRVPLGGIASAVEIADVVAFLASAAARHMTGQVLHVNGGSYLG